MTRFPSPTLTSLRALAWSLALALPFLDAQSTPDPEPAPRDPRPCCVRVVDAENGWPVPLVELRTVHEVRFVTDNAGIVAFDLPELMGRETWLWVEGHGYRVDEDSFGFRGVRITPKPGETITIEVERTHVARRVGRLTGAGLFAESEQCDALPSGVTPARPDTPLLLGQDSVQTVEYRGRLFWAWGDTSLPHYPLGVFHVTAAMTPPRPFDRLEPPLQPKFDYLVDAQGRPTGVAEMPGSGPTWLTGCTSVTDSNGRERLVATYVKVKAPLDVYEAGLCVWNDETSRFERHRVIWHESEKTPRPPTPEGHATRWTDADGKTWLLFGNPLPTIRLPATFEAWNDSSQWETLAPPERLRSATDDTSVRVHSGSLAWSEYRQRWIAIFVEAGGSTSFLGDVWYAESASPVEGWDRAIKVLAHDQYSFYNPRSHPELVPKDSPIWLFEGTYTKTFSASKRPTPRHDYNQVLYRLDLDDPGLRPVQVPTR